MALMFVLLILVSLSILQANAKATNSTKKVVEVDVIIMGAGMTGVSAGKRFADFGMTNFVVIEAQQNIGGRTKTELFGSNNLGVNLGGSWISGACYDIPNPNFECRYQGNNPSAINPMLTWALDGNYQFARTDIHEWHSVPPFMNGDGIVPPLFVDIEYEKWHDIATRSGSCIAGIYDAIWSGWRDDISYYEGLVECGWFDPFDLEIQGTIQWIEFNLEFAYNIQQYSLAMAGELGSYILYGNQDLLVTDPRGYQGITEDVSAFIPNENILLNSAVATIDYSHENGVTVMTNDGTEYHGKYGYVTFSVGVLKANPAMVLYSPPLPTWKQQAFDNIEMADYTSVYIEWPYAFWRDEHPEIDEGNIVAMNDARYGYFQWFLNLNHESLMPGSLMWRFDITEELAVRFQTQTKQETTQELINDKFRNYFLTTPIPDPVDVLVGSMSVNPYIRGAYGAYPIGYDWYGNVYDLQYSVDQVLYFGGEHTNPDDAGYVHTAYLEGIRGASMILNCLGYTGTGESCQGPYDVMQKNNVSKILKEKHISNRKNKRNGKPKYVYN